MTEPLAGVDDIDWNALETVDGSAKDAPSMLRNLASGDAKKARTGVMWLWREVLHQSTPAPSAERFVPFLVSLAQLPKQPVRWELLALLGDLACGGDHRPFLLSGFAASDPSTMALHAAVASGADGFVTALADRVAKARSAAAFALAWIPEHAEKSVPALRARLAKETDETARASVLMALAVLAPKNSAAEANDALTSNDPAQRGAGVFAIARNGTLTPAAKIVSKDLLLAKSVDGLCWHHGQLGALVIAATIHAAQRDGDVDLLASLVFSPIGHLVLGPAIARMLPGALDPANLDATTRTFLDRVTRDAAVYGLATKAWQDRGLPAQASAARDVLGFERIATRMDAPIAIDGITKRFAEHLADAVGDPSKRQPLAVALAKGRSAAEVLAFCIESVGLALTARDPDGAMAWQRVVAALLEACGDDLVAVLREANIYESVQAPDGRLVTTESIGLPMMWVLAKRDRDAPIDRLRTLQNSVGLAREIDVQSRGPMLGEALRALDDERRAALLANIDLYAAHTRAFAMPLVLETPDRALATILTNGVGRMRDQYAYGRKQPHSEFSNGYDVAALKKLSPREHPLVKEKIEPVQRYVDVLRGAGLADASEALHKAVEKFLGM